MDQKVEPESELGKAFSEALLRSMRVATLNDEEEPAPITQDALAKRAGVSTANIKRYLNGEGGSAKVATIERLAAALGVPPAFLLMRRDDWVALANAVGVVVQMLREEAPQQRAAADDGSLGPNAAACAGIAFAHDTQLLQRRKSFQPPEVNALLKRIESSVASTSGIPPYPQLAPSQRMTLLAVCAFVGTTTTTNESEQ